MAASRDWWTALGSRNALSVWSWILPTIAAVAFTLVFEISAFDYRPAPRLALIVLVQVVLIPFMVAGCVLLRRQAMPRPALGLATFVALGLVRGVAVDGLAPFIEPVARNSLLYQLALNVSYALLTLPFVAIVVDSVRRHRELRARVLAEGQRWERALQEAEEQFVLEYARYREQVDTEVMARVVHLQDEIASLAREAAGSGAEASAHELRRLSAEVVRPLSHELILEPTGVQVIPAALAAAPPRIGFRELLRAAPHAPFSGHWAVCVVMGLLGLVGLSTFNSAALLIANLAWDVVAFGLVPALLATLIPPSWQRWPAGWAWLASACAWTILGSVGVLVSAALMSALTGTGIVYWGVVVAYVALSALTAVAFAGFRRQADLDVELTAILARQEVLASRLMHRIDHERRELGLVLHGAVQASLTRAALALERWGAAGEADARDPAALPAVIEEVRRALDFAVGALDIRPPDWGGLEEVLRGRLRLWEGAVTCAWAVDPDVAQVADAMLAHRIGDVVGEAVTNAVRHGQAERVDVGVVLEGDWILVRVRDDGVGPVGARHPGAGLGQLGHAGVAWSLERHGSETLLTVRLPAMEGRVMETEQSAGAATAWA